MRCGTTTHPSPPAARGRPMAQLQHSSCPNPEHSTALGRWKHSASPGLLSSAWSLAAAKRGCCAWDRVESFLFNSCRSSIISQSCCSLGALTETPQHWQRRTPTPPQPPGHPCSAPRWGRDSKTVQTWEVFTAEWNQAGSDTVCDLTHCDPDHSPHGAQGSWAAGSAQPHSEPSM